MKRRCIACGDLARCTPTKEGRACASCVRQLMARGKPEVREYHRMKFRSAVEELRTIEGSPT